MSGPQRKFVPMQSKGDGWRITAMGPFTDEQECKRACGQVQRAYDRGTAAPWWRRLLGWRP